jgi:signal transduction histidine kinase
MQAVKTAETAGNAAHEQGVRPLWATFRHILLVVFLIFVFSVVQMFVLRRVCNTGMQTAASLEHQGLPTLNELASLQEHLAIFRLNSYEYLFAREEEKAAKAKAVETVAAQTRAELEHIKALFPEGEGRRLASNLKDATDDLYTGFRKLQSLVDSDFAAAMKAMDQDMPPLADRVASAANALKDYGYQFSGGQANATFGSFGWIKENAVMFGVANIFVAFGAVVFVLLAARRSRAQLSNTLARLDERTQELAGSLSLISATLEATTNGILSVDTKGRVGNYNQQFLRMWRISEPAEIMKDRQSLLAFILPQLKHPETFARHIEELAFHPEQESYHVLELLGDRVFECFSKPQRIQDKICGRVWSTRDVSDQKRMQREVDKTHQQLLLASRQAGMAEIASNVLHNVGNVLNSVNVSATLVVEKARESKISSLAKVVALLREHEQDLGAFIASDSRGKQLPGYLAQLSEYLQAEQAETVSELDSLRRNIEHIKEIVAMQQSYARVSGVKEIVNVRDLVEDSLRMNTGALSRHGVDVIREFEDAPPISVEKHKILQILVNLVRNAKYACDDSGRPDKRLTVRVTNSEGRIKIIVADNGVGIPAGNLTRIFSHGFTTRKGGHGFGLHSGALAAQEMGGRLLVHSDGPGQGATFTLELRVPSEI